MSASSTVMRRLGEKLDEREQTESQRELFGSTAVSDARQALPHEIDCKWVGPRANLLKVPPFAEGQRPEIVTRASRRDLVEVVHRRRTKNVEDERQLVMVVAPREEGLAGDHLREDATDRPDVDCACVLFEGWE